MTGVALLGSIHDGTRARTAAPGVGGGPWESPGATACTYVHAGCTIVHMTATTRDLPANAVDDPAPVVRRIEP
jgi:hypothetical protein